MIARPGRPAFARLAILTMLLLSACNMPPSASTPPTAATPAPASTPAVEPASAPPTNPQEPEARTNGRITPNEKAARPAVVQNNSRNLVGQTPSAAHVSVDEAGDISLNYVDTDIRELVRLILGDTLKVNYSIDPGYQGLVTIRTARPLRREELLSTLQGLLAQAGGTMTYEDGIFRIGAAGNDAVVPPVVDAGSTEMGTQVLALRYASAKQLAAMLQPYVGEGARMIADTSRNVLVITGAATARQNIVDLVKVFDVDYLAGQSYALFPVRSGDPEKVATQLESALQLDPDGPLGGTLKVVPVDEANAIMVIAQQKSYLDRASELIEQLDDVEESAGRTAHIYFLKNTQALDLQLLLQRAFNPPAGGAGGGEPGSLAPGEQSAALTATPMAPPNGTASLGGGPAGAPPGPGIGPQASPLGAPATTPSGAANASGANQQAQSADAELNSQASGSSANGPQIIADTKSNALIIMATDDEYEKIAATARKLDLLPLQVMIEAVVAEVTLNDSLQFGVQYFLSHGSNQLTLTNAQSTVPTPAVGGSQTSTDANGNTITTGISNASLFPGILAPAFPGFAIARTAGIAQFAIEALKSVTDVRVISAPKLLIANNQEASLQVGDLVPTINQTATSVITSNAPIVNSVQYQSTGVILDVKPRINAGGLVTIDIDQEVSQPVTTTSSGINSPTFQQRKIQSRIVVQDGDTVSLGGLISDNKQNGSSGIPLLSDIPVVGSLFSTKTHSDLRTEIIVLLTPHVVHDARGARAMTEELRRKLPGAASVAP
jgi:general secretion pathway protein D